MGKNKLNKILELYPEYDSVLGPYRRSDGRQHIVLNNSKASKKTKGKTKTISYPKALKEIEISKRLNDNETVHHKDWNVDNNKHKNLEVKDRKKHTSQDAIRVEVEEIKCPMCGKKFTPSKSQTDKRNKNKPKFCSKSCAGKYGAEVQNNKIDKIPAQKVKKTYVKYL